jgi:DNA-binding XRE family transcriptional regulator
MTQIDLAGHFGDLSQAAVSAFERGDKAPSIAIVLQCADLFGVATNDLLRDTV